MRISLMTLTLALAVGVAGSVVQAQDQVAQPPVSPDPTGTTTTEPTTMPVATPVVADQSTPRGALRVLSEGMREGDKPAVLGVLHAANPEEQKVAEAMADIAKAMANVRSATLEKFGAEAAAQLGGDTAAMEAELARLGQATETIDGETATITMPEPGAPAVNLVRQGGQWKLAISELSGGAPPEALAQHVTDTQAQSKVLQEVADEINAGKYASVDEARSALETKILQLVIQRHQQQMQQQQQQQPPPMPMPQEAPQPQPGEQPAPMPAPQPEAGATDQGAAPAQPGAME